MDKSINSSCWRLPQKKRKEIAERGWQTPTAMV
jgi:hypothetical protein